MNSKDHQDIASRLEMLGDSKNSESIPRELLEKDLLLAVSTTSAATITTGIVQNGSSNIVKL